MLLFSLLNPGDTILGLDLDSGGHLTHGSKASFSGQYFKSVSYGLNGVGGIDFDQVRDQAIKYKPKVIICGASAYPRFIDFERFRTIADQVGAYLIADVSHIAGLIVAGLHPSPIEHAHFTTTSTYKQLCGPRGGLILMGKDHDSLAADGKTPLANLVQKGVFPYFQGTPNLASIAAKARCLDYVNSEGFTELAKRILDSAKALSSYFLSKGYTVLTGGTDNHMVILDVWTSIKLTGHIAEKALESGKIVVNKNKIPGDQKSSLITSGIRIGTNGLALRGMPLDQVTVCGELIHQILSNIIAIDESAYVLDADTQLAVMRKVTALSQHFPLPEYR